MKNTLWFIKNFGLIWVIKYNLGLSKEGIDFITPGLIENEYSNKDEGKSL